MLRPFGCQTGKFPPSATRRACPPSAGVTQTSPPYVRVSKPMNVPILISPVWEARVDTKAIDLPSGENAGCTSSALLLVTLTTSRPSSARPTYTSKLPSRFEVNANRLPSGDHVGHSENPASCVTLATVETTGSAVIGEDARVISVAAAITSRLAAPIVTPQIMFRRR